MKTVLSWALAALFLCTSTSLANAGDAPSKAILISRLKTKVTYLLKSSEVPTIDAVNERVKIQFKIDDQGEIQVLHTSTDNTELDQYIREQLDDRYHHVMLANKKFVINVRFVSDN